MSAPTSPGTYDQALAAAALIQSARSTPDPVATLLRTSEQIASTRQNAADFAKQAIRRVWSSVNPYDPKQVNAFAAQAANIMGSAQTATARVAAAAQTQQLSSMGIDVGTPIPSFTADVRAPRATIADGSVDLHRHSVRVDYANDDTAHVTASDMTTEAIFQRPAVTFRYVESTGADDAAEQASLRIDTLIDDNLMLTQRLTQQEVIAQAVDLDKRGPKIVGYRRVIHPELSRSGTCGMCIAAADRIYHVAQLMPIHTHCQCTIAAVTEDQDPADQANAIDLRDLYKHAGGKTVSHLKRTRYQVDEHGELGPVLVPKSAYRARTGKPYQSSGSHR